MIEKSKTSTKNKIIKEIEDKQFLDDIITAVSLIISLIASYLLSSTMLLFINILIILIYSIEVMKRI